MCEFSKGFGKKVREARGLEMGGLTAGKWAACWVGSGGASSWLGRVSGGERVE